MIRTLKNISDEDLVIRLKKGDQEAFEEIYERYWSTLYRVAFYKLNNQEVAEELVQELFTVLWQRRETSNIESLKNYLFIAMRNHIISYVRKCAVQQKFAGMQRPFFDHDTEWRVAYNELARRIDEALQVLPEKTKTVFELSRYEDQSIPQIAKHLDASEKTVEYHLTKALKHLRTHIRMFSAAGILLKFLDL